MNDTIQHLCPFCGCVQYESGGGVKGGCLFLLIFVTGLWVLQFAMAMLGSVGTLLTTAFNAHPVVSIALIGAILYGLYRLKRRQGTTDPDR